MHPVIKHIWLFNGPARSGKDTLADLIAGCFQEGEVGREKFARPLKEGGSAALGIPLAELEEQWKDTTIPGLGFTWREYQISMSEDWYKPRFGQNIFGRLLVERLRRNPHRWHAISDSGFTVEARPLIEAFGVDCVSVFHIHRDGYTFDGDSRNWIDSGSLGVRYYHISNDEPGNPQNLLDEFLPLMNQHRLY